MILADFHFLYPLWFLLLPILAGFIWWLNQIHSGSTQWNDFIDENLRPYILSRGSGEKNKTFIISVALAGLIAIFALAGPSWDKRTVPAFQTQQGLVLAMDLSTSMILNDITPSRLVRARFKLIDLLKLRKEGQTGLVVFAGAAFAVSPLTDDVNNIIEQVKHLNPNIMPSQGSRIDLAIEEAVTLLKQSDFKKGHILLITDGLSNLKQSIESAEKAKKQGYKVSVLAIGTHKGATIPLAGGRVYTKADGTPIIAALNEEELQQVAKAGGGYYKLSELADNDIQYFQQQFSLKNSDKLNNKIVEKKDREVEYWNNAGIYLSLLLIPLALLAFRRGILFSLLFILLLPQPKTANAYEWDALWKNENQRGQIALNNNQADKALKLFKRPDWKAAAAYRNKEYKKAAQLYSQLNTADAFYNQGNAFARLGQYDKAIAAYNKALSKNKNLQDAIDNKALVEQLKKQQQKKNKKNNQKNNQNKDQKNKDNQSDDQQDQSKKNKQQNKKNNIKDDKGEQEQQSDQKNKEQKASKEKEQQEQQKQQDKDKQQQEAEKKKKEDANGVKDPKQHGRQGKKSEADKQKEKAQQLSEEEKRKQREKNQRTDQWLRKIPDDPSGLWRRKFIYQYRRRSDTRGRGNQQPW